MEAGRPLTGPGPDFRYARVSALLVAWAALLQAPVAVGDRQILLAEPEVPGTLIDRLLLRFEYYDDGYAAGYSAGLGARLGRRGASSVTFSLNKFRGKLIEASMATLEGNIGAFRGEGLLENSFRWKANYFFTFQEDSLGVIDPANGSEGSLGDRFLVHLVDNLVGVHPLGDRLHLVYGAGLDLKLSYLVPVFTLPLGVGLEWDATRQDTIGFFPTLSAEGAFNLVEFDPLEDIYYKWGYLSGAALTRIAYRTRRLSPLSIDALRLSTTSGYLFEESNANTQSTKFYLQAARIGLSTKPFWRGPLELHADYYLKRNVDGPIDYRRQEVGVEILKTIRVGAFDLLVGPSVSHYDAQLEGARLEEERYVLNVSARIRPEKHRAPEAVATFRIGHSDTVLTGNGINESGAVRAYAQAAKTAMDSIEELRTRLRNDVIHLNEGTGQPALPTALRQPLQRYLTQINTLAAAFQAGLRLVPENEDTELARLLLRSASSGLEQEKAFVKDVLRGTPEALFTLADRAAELSDLLPDFRQPIDRELLGDLSLDRFLYNLALNPRSAIADFEARLIINTLNRIRDDLDLGPIQLEKGDIYFLFVTRNIPVAGFKDKAVSFVKAKLGEAFAEEMRRTSDDGLHYLLGQAAEGIEALPITEEEKGTLRALLAEAGQDASIDAMSRLVGELSYEALLQVLGTQAGSEVLRALKDSLNNTLLVFEKDFYELSKHTFVGDDPKKLPGQYLIDDFEAAIDARKRRTAGFGASRTSSSAIAR